MRAVVEQRSGVLDRRRSNWRDAVSRVPPSDREALALRGCVDEIRVILSEHTDQDTDVLRLRTWLDMIELAVIQLDDVLQRDPR